jgi:acyl-coenzyme A thioesterase PaaI-like protein
LKLDYSEDYQECYVCGKENIHGLKLTFIYEDASDEIYTRCRFAKYMQGYSDIVHGGFISMLLDEVMAKMCLQRGIRAVTGKLEVKFNKPVYVEEEVEFRAQFEDIQKKKVLLLARCLDLNGVQHARAHGLFIRV